MADGISLVARTWRVLQEGNGTAADDPVATDGLDELTSLVGDASTALSNLTLYDCQILEGLQGCNKTFTASDIGTACIINVVLGTVCFVLFGSLRTTIKVYRARLLSPVTTVKPPPLPSGGVQQLVSWILPLVRMSDESLLKTAGLDALMYSRFLMLCVQFFLPVSLLSLGVLLPIHYTTTGADGFTRCGYKNPIVNQDELVRTTLSNVCPNDKLLWVHFVFIYLVLGWACFLLQKHYTAYATLRHLYIGMPQRQNIWAEKYMRTPSGDGRHEGLGGSGMTEPVTPKMGVGLAGLASSWSRARLGSRERGREGGSQALTSSPRSTPRSGEEGSWDGESEVFESPLSHLNTAVGTSPPEGAGHRKNNSFGRIAFRLAKWKNVASAWVTPDKVFDHAGKESKDLVHLNAQIEALGSRKKEEALLLPEGGEAVGDIAAEGEGAEAAVAEQITPLGVGADPPAEGLHERNGSLDFPQKTTVEPIADQPTQRLTTEHHAHLSMDLGGDLDQSGPSPTIVKWWETYAVESKHQPDGQRLCMARPSIRYVKAINTMQGDQMVSVNAAQYAVLVTDVPKSEEDLNTLRTLHTSDGNPDSEVRDVDAVEIDPVDDICAAVFSKIFPDSFEHVVPVKDFSKVTKLLRQWDLASRKLESLQAQAQAQGTRPLQRKHCCGLYGPWKDSISIYEQKIASLLTQIKLARREVQRSKTSRSSFVIFNNQTAAAAAAQSVLLPIDGSKFVTQRAPGPDNINWQSLFKTSNQRMIRRLCMVPFIALLIIIPAGLFSSGLTVLDAAFCQQDSELFWDWYCFETQNTQFGRLLKTIVTGWLPSILVSVYQNVVVTRSLYAIALAECIPFTLGGVDRRITSLYFYWDFFNIFLGSIFGASLFSIVGQALRFQDTRFWLEAIGQAIGASANFLTSYVLLRALLLVPLKLVFPHPGILIYLVKVVARATWNANVKATVREKYVAWEPKSFMYGREAGIAMLMSLIGVAYVATSPITCAGVAFYFVGMFVVARHHLLYVYARSYESGGELWPVLFNRFVIMLVTLAYFTACQLVTKKAWSQAIILFITTPPILYRFHRQCTKKYGEVSTNVPLDIAWRQPSAKVPPQMYVPSELRSRSVGWYPEQGKVWHGYGMPRWM